MASYAEDLYRWRVQREQQKITDRCEQIRDEYRQVSRERDQAIADGNTETAEFLDDDCQQLEKEWNEYNPPQPQYHPKDVSLIQKGAPYLNRYGARGAQAAEAVRQHVIGRMGITPD